MNCQSITKHDWKLQSEFLLEIRLVFHSSNNDSIQAVSAPKLIRVQTVLESPGAASGQRAPATTPRADRTHLKQKCLQESPISHAGNSEKYLICRCPQRFYLHFDPHSAYRAQNTSLPSSRQNFFHFPKIYTQV